MIVALAGLFSYLFSEVKQKWSNFHIKNVRVVPSKCSPSNYYQARLKGSSIRNAQEKTKENRGKIERKEEQNADQIAKINK